jgi:hypothetical protein
MDGVQHDADVDRAFVADRVDRRESEEQGEREIVEAEVLYGFRRLDRLPGAA